MGGKPSNNMQSDRPESGGADHDEIRSENGLLDKDKEKFASQHAQPEPGKGASNRKGRLQQESRDP